MKVRRTVTRKVLHEDEEIRVRADVNVAMASNAEEDDLATGVTGRQHIVVAPVQREEDPPPRDEGRSAP